MCVTLDEAGRFKRMEQFMPSNTFSNPVDLEFNDRGELYLLEYGKAWFSENKDARLVRLKYSKGNREPIARIASSEKYGAAPLSVRLSAVSSIDYDQDLLSYEWYIDGKFIGNSETPHFTFQETGKHTVRLIVKDIKGQLGVATEEIWAGNSKPELTISAAGNQTFYWDDHELNYKVEVKDKEDGQLNQGIAPQAVTLSLDYLEEGFDLAEIAQGHQQQTLVSSSERLIEQSNCLSCHQMDKASVGPSYRQVAERYKEASPAVVQQLISKISMGGSGVWGERAMPAHPHLKYSEVKRMVDFILSLDDAGNAEGLPLIGKFAFKKHLGRNTAGMYIIQATYTDRGGNGIPPITTRQQVLLRHPRLQATDYSLKSHARRMKVDTAAFSGFEEDQEIVQLDAGNYIGFEHIDLTDIAFLRVNLLLPPQNNELGMIEIRTDAPSGPVIGKQELHNGSIVDNQRSVLIPIEKTTGFHDVLLYFRNLKGGQQSVDINTIEFLVTLPES